MSKIKNSTIILRFLSVLFSICVILLGVIVIVGWYTKNINLLTVIPDAVAMQYNTALGFIMAGLGLLFYNLNFKKPAYYLGIALFLLGFLTSLEYILNFNLGIDELFMDHYITDKVSHKGRMAPNTALCFTLTGLLYFIFFKQKLIKHSSRIIGFLGFIIYLLGTLAFIGYFIDIDNAYSWGNLTQMAIHTTVGFILVGLGSILGIWFFNGGKTWIESSITRRLSIYLLFPILTLYLVIATYSIFKVKEATFKEAFLKLEEVGWKHTSILDKQLSEVEEIAHSTKRFLLTQNSLQENEINSVLLSNLEINKAIYGSAIVFAPHMYKSGQKLFAPYAFKQKNTLNIIDFSVDGYDYSDGQHTWYDIPKNNNVEVWTEPYIDVNFQNKLMSTYAVPVFKNDEFYAITTVDILLEDLNKLLETEELKDFAFGIISGEGNFLYANYDDSLIGKNIYDQGDSRSILQEDRSKLADLMLKGESGSASVDLVGGDAFHAVFNPIGTTKWSFFIGTNESKIFVPVKRVINQMALFFILILVLFILIIYGVSKQLSQRIGQLSLATNKIAKGNIPELDKLISNDEIGVLSQNFARMSEELSLREHDLKQLNEQLEEKVRLRTKDLEQERGNLQAYFDSSPIAVMITVNNEVAYKNGKFSELVGGNVKGYFPEMALAEKDVKKLSSLYTNNKEVRDYQLQILNKSNKPIDIILNSLNIEYNNKKGILSWIVDVTGYVDLNRNFVSLLDRSSDFIYFKDTNRVFSAVSQTVADVSNYKSRKDLVGLTDKDVFPKEHVAIYEAEEDILLSGEKDFIETITPYKKLDGDDGWVSTKKFALKDDYGHIIGIFGMSRDITEIKQIQIDLKKAKDVADEANRSKSTFLANMSHEIRTPMNAVLGFSELLEKLVKTNIEKSYLKSIITSGKSLLALINDILDLSKIEAGKIDLHNSFFNLSTLLEEIRSIFTIKIKEKSLDFILEIDEEIPQFVYLDETRFRQVLINLINNAIKFTEKGYVKIKVTPSNLNYEENWLNFSVSIEDTGIGIKEEFKKNLFETFTQQDGSINKKFGGTGLGLAISKNLTELMNGEITFSSEEGKGTVFNINLKEIQFKEELDLEEKQDEIDVEGLIFEEATILIIDDIEDNRKYIKGALASFKFNLIEATNGIEGLDILNNLNKKVDLIITDLRMPKMDGFELIDRIQKNDILKLIPIIATSASVMEFNVNKARKLRFDDFLAKPVRVNDLITCLIKYIPSNSSNLKIETKEMELIVNSNNLEIDCSETVLSPVLNALVLKNNTLKDKQSMSDIESFAKELQESGEKYNAKPLSDYGNSLIAAVESFDVEKMLVLINGFDDFILKIREHLS